MLLFEEPIQAAVWHSLNHYAYGDATFLAERLHTELPSDDALHLLATCYFRSDCVAQAYDLLSKHGAKTAKSRFLLAKCCQRLKKNAEAETILSPAHVNKEDQENNNPFAEAAPFALQILSGLYAQSERSSLANECDRRALRLNPFLWKSFEALCRRGDAPDPSKTFSLEHVDSFRHCHGVNPILSTANSSSSGGGGPAHTLHTLPTARQKEQQQHHQQQQQQQHSHHHQPLQQLQLSTPHPNITVTSTPCNPATSDSALLTPMANVIDVTPPQVTEGNNSSMQIDHPQIDGTPLMAMTPMSNTSLNSTSGGRGMISGIASLNYSSASTDFPSTEPRGGGGLMPPPLGRKKLVAGRGARQNLTNLSSGYRQADAAKPEQPTPTPPPQPSTNLGGFLDDSFNTPTFGHVARCMTTSKQLDLSSVRMKLDMSSPSLFVLSPVVTSTMANASTGGGESKTTAGDSPSNTTSSNDHKPARQKRSQRSFPESSPLKPNSANACLNQNTPGLSTPASLVTPNNQNGAPMTRRSSRLFGSSQQSVKENSTSGVQKAPTKKPRGGGGGGGVGGGGGSGLGGGGAPKSPSRKSNKTRTALSAAQQQQQTDSLEEKNNERNRAETHKLSGIGEKDPEEKQEQLPPLLKKSSPASQQQSQQNPSSVPAVSQACLGAQALSIQKASADGLMRLMRQLGAAAKELWKYDCRKAVQLLEAVSPPHSDSALVLGLLGRAHFELAEYKEAKRYFREMRDREKHRMEHTEIYSTTLWHLQEDVELSALAQELTKVAKTAPEAWCAAGNCFSHLKEHENAIKFFQRAIQVDPNFSYAYTLLGHEYVMIEELEKALACYRNAVRIDPRHYNAWYGIGLTYYKQERFSLADVYYRRALSINPSSPVLMCHVAVVQHAMQRTDRALDTLDTAIRLAPKSSLCKFERASILFAAERHDEALAELEELKELVPKESPVYFLLGKVHNKLNNTHMALMHFSWAMDLDPKGANSQIKDALDPTINNRAVQEEGGGGGAAATGSAAGSAAGQGEGGGSGEDEAADNHEGSGGEAMVQGENLQDMSESFHPDDQGTGASTSQESLEASPAPAEAASESEVEGNVQAADQDASGDVNMIVDDDDDEEEEELAEEEEEEDGDDEDGDSGEAASSSSPRPGGRGGGGGLSDESL